MSRLRQNERELLADICEKNDISIELINQLLKSAKKFSYENSSQRLRNKEYIDLINFHLKLSKGDKQ